VCTVPSADDYRELADKCFQSAREAHNEDERMMYLTLAQTWLEEASRRDSATSSLATGAPARAAPPRTEAGVSKMAWFVPPLG
jgi:hypothetical protein